MSIQMAVRSLGQAIALGELHIVSDADLLRQFVNSRDEESFRKLVERHGPIVKAVCLRSCGDRQLSEDAFQKTFLELARKASKIRSPEALSGWLYKVAHRIGLKNRKRKTSQPVDQAEQSVSVLDRISARELLDRVDAEIVKLPDHYRSALVACSIEERSIEEAAEQFQTTPHAVRGWLQRGREQLRKRLKWHGIELSFALTALAACSENQITAADLALAATALASSSTSSFSGPITLLLDRAKSPWIIAATTITLCIAGWGIITSPQAKSKHENKEPKQNQAEVFTTASNLTVFDPIPPKKDTEPPLPEGAVARFGSTRMRQKYLSDWLEFSQDGKYLYSIVLNRPLETNPGVTAWDLATGQVARTFSYGQFTDNASLNSDGKTMTLIVIDDGKNPNLGTPADMPKSGGEFSQLVAHRVDLSTGKIVHSSRLAFPAIINYDHNQAISPDGSLIATHSTGDRDTFLSVFSVETGRELCRIEKRPEAKLIQGGLSFTHNNRNIVFLDRADFKSQNVDYNINLHDAKTGALVKRLSVKGSLIWTPLFTNDGKLLSYIVYTSTGRDVCIVDWETGKEILKKSYPNREITGGAYFTPDGKSYLLASNNGLLVADVKTGREAFRFPSFYNTSRPAISPDGIYFASPNSKSIGIWNLKTGEPHPASAEPFDSTIEVRFTERGTLRIFGDSLVDHDLATGRQTRFPWPIEGIRNGYRETTSSDGSLAAVRWHNDTFNVPAKDHDIAIVNLDTRKVASRFKFPPGRITEVSFSKDHRDVFLCIEDEKSKSYPIYRIDVVTGKTVSQWQGCKGPTYQMVSSDDGRYLATFSQPSGLTEKNAVMIWDIKTGKPIHEIALTTKPTEERINLKNQNPRLQGFNQNPPCGSMKFLPNGQLMIQTDYLWQDQIIVDPESGKEIERVCFLGERVSSLDVSLDSNLIYYHEVRFDEVNSSEPTESKIKVFNRKTKTHTVLFDGKRSRQKTVQASADGRWLATTDDLGVAYLWDTKTLFPKGFEP